MDLMEKYTKNEAKIKKLQEENKNILRQKKEQEKKEHLAYLNKLDEMLRSCFFTPSKKIDLEFLEYALLEMGEELRALQTEWQNKNS